MYVYLGDVGIVDGEHIVTVFNHIEPLVFLCWLGSKSSDENEMYKVNGSVPSMILFSTLLLIILTMFVF